MKMSDVNKRILDAIENSDLAREMKNLLRNLLLIEFKNLGDKKPRYGEDYDRVIKKFAGLHGKTEGE